MASTFAPGLPLLPLLLWEPPPGLELILAQEGVPFVRVRDAHPLAFGTGRFVLYDGRRIGSAMVRARLGPTHVAINIDALRRAEPIDPFAALIDTKAARATWRIGALALTERVARRDKAAIRRRLLARLREAVNGAGGLWARLAPYPFPYRSAFNFRADLDEHFPDDYARFARARKPLDGCSTHFLNTHAYGQDRRVLDDLAGLDVQSHAHFHVIYRNEDANRRNLDRAHALLVKGGFDPVGFAAPEGRWNPGLDRVIEDLGYVYSSDFQLGYDDFPFFPWRDGRFSTVLQVPIHPICEGLFLEAGANGRAVAEHLVSVVRAKVASGEPAFVYGHPERRLAHCPEVLAALADEVAGNPLLWRVPLTRFVHWWRWRANRRWGMVARGQGQYEVQFDDWDARHRLALEVVRGGHVASLPLTAPRTTLRLEGLAYERRTRVDLPAPALTSRPHSLKSFMRAALDWETVTPIEDLPDGTLTDRFRKRLRRWKQEGGKRS
ncbi:MAG: hypothetical protein ABI353_03685 [Isosphaeraceae bacterium]